jgi:VIT1/CCC1 family predicted Fe2+/Mn2+ transporter
MRRSARRDLLSAQRNELTKHRTYTWLAAQVDDDHNRLLLERAAEDEIRHYHILRGLTDTDVTPHRVRLLYYRWVSRLLGLSFGLKLMERGRELRPQLSEGIESELPELAEAIAEEQSRETDILDLLNEERLDYAGAIVLGLNDALVELTGALVGFTFALRNATSIAAAGIITGVAASMSMGVSQFLSAREDDTGQGQPATSAVYTGISYLATVVVLVLPYILSGNVYLAMGTMLGLSLLVILTYNVYIAIAKGEIIWRRFLTMAGLSLGVAAVSFVIGYLARQVLGIEL